MPRFGAIFGGAIFFATVAFPAFFAAVRAVERATATACFCGIPAFISFEMFFEIDFFEYPLVSGMGAL
jgi:hypothetical protein